MATTGRGIDARFSSDPRVSALAALLELRDGYAASDGQELVELALALGERLTLPAHELSELGHASCLHDIGKVGVPDRILHKPGQLDAEERLVMERHPVWGAETLERIPGMEGVALLVRSHHERWDGNGYPDGLVGDATPLGARIIGVCEAYRAMTTERPHRRSLDPGHALGVIGTAAGSHFDPAIVDALRDVLADRGITAVEPPAPDRRGRFARQPAPPAGYGQRLPEAFARLDELPALSESRDRLLALLREPRPALGAIITTVETDPALALAVLRLANGRAGRRGTITGIPDAVAALSPEGIEILALHMTATPLLDPRPGWSARAEALRIHSLATRRVMDRLALAVDHDDRDAMLVAALVHDVGKLALAFAHPGYPDTVHGGASTPEQRVRAERHKLGIDHAVVGAVLLGRWGLPKRLAEAVEHHHDDDARGDAALVRLADLLAHHSHGRSIDARRLQGAANAVGLHPDDLGPLMFDQFVDGGADRRPDEPCPLTSSQLQAIRGLAEGKVYNQIAQDMGIAPSTVRSHLHDAYQRLGVADRAQAVLLCSKHGWLD